MSDRRGDDPSVPAPTTVAVVGLGVMGAPIAAHLVRAATEVADGSRVLVTHRSRQRALDTVARDAEYVETARELGAADIVISMLPDLPDLEPMLTGADGLLAGVDSPTVLVIGSTSSPQGVRDLDARLREESGGLVRVIDAPVSGGEDGAVAGTLSIMVGGDDEPVAAALPTLSVFGTAVHLGPIGAGQVAKACNQLIVSATILALGEAAVIADRAGIDVARLFDLLGGGYAGSRILATRGGRIASEDYAPSGVAKYMVKDLGFAQSEAERSGTRAELLTRLQATFTELTAAGFGDQDIAVTRAYVESLTR